MLEQAVHILTSGL